MQFEASMPPSGLVAEIVKGQVEEHLENLDPEKLAEANRLADAEMNEIESLLKLIGIGALICTLAIIACCRWKRTSRQTHNKKE